VAVLGPGSAEQRYTLHARPGHENFTTRPKPVMARP